MEINRYKCKCFVITNWKYYQIMGPEKTNREINGDKRGKMRKIRMRNDNIMGEERQIMHDVEADGYKSSYLR